MTFLFGGGGGDNVSRRVWLIGQERESLANVIRKTFLSILSIRSSVLGNILGNEEWGRAC